MIRIQIILTPDQPTKAAEAIVHFTDSCLDGLGLRGFAVADFVAEAHIRLMRGSWEHLYAYVRPSTAGQWGELLIVAEDDDAPEGCQLITGETIPPTDRQGITRWLARFAGKLPVFPL